MASNFYGDPYDYPSRWDVVPYIPPTPLLDPEIFNDPETEFCSSEGLELVVQEGTNGCSDKSVHTPDPSLPQNNVEPEGLESLVHEGMLPSVEKDVLSTDPVSIHQRPLVVTEIEQPQVAAGIQKSRKGKGPITTKVIGVSTISFDLIRLVDDPHTYVLVMHDVESSPEVEEMPGMKDEARLPRPHLLKGWMKEIRERPNGTRDKFYSHSACKRLFRSVVEVVNYIKTNNNLLDAKLHNKTENQLQVYQGCRISEASPSSNANNKRKKDHPQDKTKFKKTSEEIRIEEFFASAHQNLMKSSPPRPDAQEGRKGTATALRVYFAAAYENMIRGLQNENGNRNNNIGNNIGNSHPQSAEDVEDWINELLNS